MTKKDYAILTNALREAYNSSFASHSETKLAILFTALKIASAIEEKNPKFRIENFISEINGRNNARTK